MRKHYLDNIRWATVLLVVVYHVAYMFNGVGIFGGVPGAKNLPWADTLAAIVYPWFMVLLFVIAGMSSRYALEKRSNREFLLERACKLLVPSTLGLFVLHWVTGYLNIKLGGGLEFIPGFLVYPIAAISGIGPLWFIQMLFLFSCLLVLLRVVDKGDRLWKVCAGTNPTIIYVLFALLYFSSRALNLPVLTMYRFGIYLTAFLIGYLILSHEEVMDRVETMRVPTLLLAIGSGTAYTLSYGGGNFTADDCLHSMITNFYLWMAVLAILGWGLKCWNRDTSFTRYMKGSSFGIYILHYPVLLTICYGLCSWFDFPAGVNYILALALTLPVTFGLYEGIRRVPVVRFLVLGIRKK